MTSVTVAGEVRPRELEALMATSLALVQPSQMEGLGLPVLEAVLADLPVVSSPVPAVTEMGPAGLPTFDPGSVSDMATTIDRAIDWIDDGRYWREVDRAGWLRTRPTPGSLADQVLHRLAQRWKLTGGRSVEQTESDLKRLFPETHWNALHLRIIYYGREHCTARGCDGTVCELCRTLFPNRRRPVAVRK